MSDNLDDHIYIKFVNITVYWNVTMCSL